MTTPQPGWYDDGSGTQRWWDGDAWTEHVAPSNVADPARAAARSVRRRRRLSRRWIIAVAVVGIAAIAAAVTVLVIKTNHAADRRAQAARQAAFEKQPTQVVDRFVRSIGGPECSSYNRATTSTAFDDEIASQGCADLFKAFGPDVIARGVPAGISGGSKLGEIQGDTATVTATSPLMSWATPYCRTKFEFTLDKFDDGWRLTAYSAISVPIAGHIDTICE